MLCLGKPWQGVIMLVYLHIEMSCQTSSVDAPMYFTLEYVKVKVTCHNSSQAKSVVAIKCVTQNNKVWGAK